MKAGRPSPEATLPGPAVSHQQPCPPFLSPPDPFAVLLLGTLPAGGSGKRPLEPSAGSRWYRHIRRFIVGGTDKGAQ